MSAAGRRRAFVIASLMVALAVALSGLLASPPKERRPRPGGDAQAPARRLDAPPAPRPAPRPQTLPSATEPPNPRSGRRDLRAAAVEARRFLGAFASYQRGRVDARTRRTLVATSSPRVARQLLDRPPRDAERGRAARVLRIEMYGPWRGRVKASAVVAYRGVADRSLIELALARQRGGWRVVELYP